MSSVKTPVIIATFLSALSIFGAIVANAQTDLKGQIDEQVQAAVGSAELKEDRDPRLVAAEIIKILLTLLGTFFLVLVLMGGYWYLTAQGDEEQVAKGQKTIQAAIIGFAIIMISYSVVNFVGNRIGPAVVVGGKAPR